MTAARHLDAKCSSFSILYNHFHIMNSLFISFAVCAAVLFQFSRPVGAADSVDTALTPSVTPAASNDALRPLTLSGLIAPNSLRLDLSTSYVLVNSSPSDSTRLFSQDISLTVPLTDTLSAHAAASYSVLTAPRTGSTGFWNDPRAGISWFPKTGDSFGLGLDLTVGFPGVATPPASVDDGANTTGAMEVSAFWDFSPTIAFVSAGVSGRFGGAGENWEPSAKAGLMFLLTPELTAVAALEWGMQNNAGSITPLGTGGRSDNASIRLGVVYSISRHYSGTLDARIGLTQAAPDLGITLGISYGF